MRREYNFSPESAVKTSESLYYYQVTSSMNKPHLGEKKEKKIKDKRFSFLQLFARNNQLPASIPHCLFILICLFVLSRFQTNQANSTTKR